MAGRGRGILQALKEKKERERSESPSSAGRRSSSQEPQIAQHAAVGGAAATTTGLAGTSAGGLPAGRGVGRGQLAALLASRQPSTPHTPSTPASATMPSEPGVQVVSYSPDKASQPIPKRLSPIQPLLEQSSHPTLQKTSTLREVCFTFF